MLAALGALVPELPKLAAGGRTDRGVHATGQVVSFWSRGPLDLGQIGNAIDQAAPGDLVVRDLREVPRSFHAQFSASGRRYVYLLPSTAARDVARINRMLQPLLGRRSFTAFARDTPPGRSLVRTLRQASARICGSEEGPLLRFDFEADGFLRRQIRVLVATALRESEARAPDDALLELAEGEDRRRTANPIDPGGLYLVKVRY